MNPYSNFTDGQLAEWDQLHRRVEHLNALLLAEQQANAALRAERASDDERMRAMEADFRADFGRQDADITRLADTLAATEQKLRDICNALVPVLVDWLDTYSAFKDEALADVVVERRKAAVALMRRMTPWSM